MWLPTKVLDGFNNGTLFLAIYSLIVRISCLVYGHQVFGQARRGFYIAGAGIFSEWKRAPRGKEFVIEAGNRPGANAEMLADLLNKVKEQAIVEIEQRADIIEGRGLPSVGRTQRLNSLFDEVIAALRYGDVDGQAPPLPAVVDSAFDSEERELVRRYIIEKIEQHQLEASAREAVVVS